MKNKYLVESARITDAYFRMYSKNINEAVAGDAGKFTKGIGNNSQFTGGVAKGTPGDAGKFTKGVGDKGKFIDGIAKATGKMVGNSAKGVTGDAGKFTKEIEYPENGDVEYTGEEEDYLTGKTNVRPKTLAPDAREKYRKTFESCGKKRGCAKKVNEADDAVKYLVAKLGKDGYPVASKGGNGAYGAQFSEFDSLADAKKKCKEMSSKSGSTCIVSKVGKDGNEKVVFKCGGKKVDEVADGKPHVDPVDIYTIQISRVLDNGDQDGMDVMKYAKTYYDIHDAVEDAKKAYSEYSNGDDVIEVDILAGEREHESGDIYGEPYVILTVKDGKLLDVTGGEVDTTEEEFIGNIDDANESYEDNGEIDYGDDGSKYAEDYADDKLKNAISVIKRICAKNGAKVTGISEGDRTHAIVNIKIKDPNKVPGVGFDMNRIMGIGYGIEKACEKAGINAFIAGGYIGNNAQLYLSKDNPIVESYATKIMGNISPEDVEAADLGLISHEKVDPYNFNNDDDEEEVSNEEILAQYRKFLGNAMPVVETKEGEIYFEYDPNRNVLAYGGACNTGLLEDGYIEYDKSESMLTNLENLHDEIYAKFGYPEDMD